MGKKNRVPESEKSAFDRAKAAFDRVGEDYVPASKAVELPKKEEPAEVSDAAATQAMSVNVVTTQETSVDAAATPETQDTDNPEAVSESDAAAMPDEPAEALDADSAEPVDSDANGVEAADSDANGVKTGKADTSDVDSVEPETNAEVSEAADSAETSEVSVETPEASTETPKTPVSEAADIPEASDSTATPKETADTPEASAETPETSVDSAATPEVSANVPDIDSAAPETVDDSATPEPEAVKVAEEEADEAEGDSDDFWTFDADEPESEVTEMEKLTMETKEITLGVHRSSSAHADTQSREQEKKPKFRLKAFDQLKDALRTRADSAEHVDHAEQSDDSTPPSGGSSRDAAIRKRVMQIEDEETRNYLLDRVLPQMTWYSKKSANYQKKYHQLMTAAICLGALIPVFSVWANNAAFKVILAFLGASVTAVNAYLALYKYQELWIAYRSAREELIHTLYSYFNKAGVFAQKKMTEEELNVLLVEVCENTLSKENGGWTTTVLQKTS